MSNPWDPFPLPTRGDPEECLTFEGVGRVITEWEYVEFGLSRLYSIFVGAPDMEEAIYSYGEGGIFRVRAAIVKAAADRYFTKHCNQHVEARFDELCMIAANFADPRCWR